MFMIQIIKKQLLATALTLFPILASAEVVSSPNGNVSLQFALDEGGRPTYQLTYKQQQVVKTSRLGLELAGQENLMDGFQVSDTETSTFDETWQPVWGETRDIRNHYNELLVKMSQPKTDRQMNIRFRVYDEGIGLRYEFPVQKNLVYFVVKDTQCLAASVLRDWRTDLAPDEDRRRPLHQHPRGSPDRLLVYAPEPR